MSANELAWLFGLILLGTISGIASGWITAIKSKSMESAIIRAFIPAVFIPLSLCFFAGLFDSYQPKGFSISNALLAGVGMMFYLGFGMTVCAAPASVISAIVSHAVFSRCRQKSKEDQSGRREVLTPAPTPPVIRICLAALRNDFVGRFAV